MLLRGVFWDRAFDWLAMVTITLSTSTSTNLSPSGQNWNYTKRKQTKAKQAAIINRLKSPDFGVLNVDRYANVNAQCQLNIP